MTPADDLAVISTTLGQMVGETTGDVKSVLSYFAFSHLPAHLQPTSAMFARVAVAVVASAPPSRETLKALDHLLAAKDAAVRARLVLS